MSEEIIGRQIIGDFQQCQADISSAETIRAVLLDVIEQTQVTLLQLFVHQFTPHGVTAAALIAESHIFIHTWPEKNYVALDVFTCGNNALPERAVEVMRTAFKPEEVQTQLIERKAATSQQRS